MSHSLAITCTLALSLGCSNASEPPKGGPEDGAPPPDASLDGADGASPDATPSPDAPTDDTPGVTCPPRGPGSLALPATDRWSGLVTLKSSDDTRWLSPIHASLMPDGTISMIGWKRKTVSTDPELREAKTGSSWIWKPPMDDPASDVTSGAQVIEPDYADKLQSLVCAGHTFLEDGRILAVGGETQPDDLGVPYGQMFTLKPAPAAGEWKRITPDMPGGKSYYPSVLRLPDARALVYSAFVVDLKFNRAIQTFDAAAYDSGRDPWALLSPHEAAPIELDPATSSDYTHMYLLPRPVETDGKKREVLFLGGDGHPVLYGALDSFAEAKDRFRARTRRPAPTGATKVADGAGSALLPIRLDDSKGYANGSVLVFGGSKTPEILPRADIYDPVADRWSGGVSLGIGRHHPTPVLLPDGNVFIVNGHWTPGSPGDPRVPQIFDPLTGRFASGKKSPEDLVRGYHNVALLLPDARVLVAGGRNYQYEGPPPDFYAADERADARFYSPYYLSVLPPNERPVITSLPDDPVVHFGKAYSVEYEHGPIHRAVLIATASITHSTDMNGRMVELAIGAGEKSGSLTVTGPASGAVAPPGHYMLFLLRKVCGVAVPSVARIVRVGA